MRNQIRWSMKLTALVAAILLASPTTVLAYADPGTGAFIYQAGYAAILGGMYYLRQLLNRIWVRRK